MFCYYLNISTFYSSTTICDITAMSVTIDFLIIRTIYAALFVINSLIVNVMDYLKLISLVNSLMNFSELLLRGN